MQNEARFQRAEVSARSAAVTRVLIACILLFELQRPLRASPIIEMPGYQLDLIVSTAGAADGLKLSPGGDLFVTDYGGGRILRVANARQAGLNQQQVYAT